MKYKMKIDLWIRLVIYASLAFCIALMFIVPSDEQWIMILTNVFMFVLFIPFFYGYVELEDEQIIAKVGPFKQRIPYENIKSIRLCRNWLSSMAMTIDRIEIKEHKKGYFTGTTYIGPQQREECFQELKRRCYNLEEK